MRKLDKLHELWTTLNDAERAARYAESTAEARDWGRRPWTDDDLEEIRRMLSLGRATATRNEERLHVLYWMLSQQSEAVSELKSIVIYWPLAGLLGLIVERLLR